MKVSVIVPTYNRLDLLIETIESILNQNYPDFEIIIVDDGSTDGTAVKFQTYLAGLPNDIAAKLLFQYQANSGAPVARNLGFKLSSGDCIVFMDSDDLLTAKGLTEGVRALVRSGKDYVHLPIQKCNEVGLPLVDSLIGGPFEGHPVDIAGYHWQTMGAIYRRSTVEKVGPWNPELSGSQDWEYQARVKMSGAKGEFVNSIMGYWRTHEHGRIGTSAYNHRYVLSVEKACIAIGSEASAKQLLDRKLRIKLLKRLIIHAIEAGAYGAYSDRQRLLRTARIFARGIEILLLILGGAIYWKRIDKALLTRGSA